MMNPNIVMKKIIIPLILTNEVGAKNYMDLLCTLNILFVTRTTSLIVCPVYTIIVYNVFFFLLNILPLKNMLKISEHTGENQTDIIAFS